MLQQCRKVGEAVYMTNWYKLPQKTVLSLILIILRSSIVIKMTAGKIVHMSISTFGDVSEKTKCLHITLQVISKF